MENKAESYCIDMDKIRCAQERISDKAIITPLVFSDNLSQMCNCKLYFKLENLQRCKAFKFRGAYNKLKQLPPGSTVCAVSAGNHSQGIALASTLCGSRAVIYMPKNAMISKVQATRNYGGTVILEGETFDDSKQALAIAMKKHPEWIFVPPYEDPDIMAGTGTIGMEIFDQLPDVDTVVIPIGGGGLISGATYALKKLKPGIRIIGCQMASCPVTCKQFYQKKGQEICVDAKPTSTPLADGIAVKSPGKLNLDIINDMVDEIVLTTEDEVAMAISLLAERGKVVAEGAGACAFASILSRKFKFTENEKVCAIVSGGNIPLQMLQRCIERSLFIKQTRINMNTITPNGSKYTDMLITILTKYNAEVIALTKMPHSHSVANKEHYNIIMDVPNEEALKFIESDIQENGWYHKIENTRILE